MENNQLHDARGGCQKETPLILSRNRYGDVSTRKVSECESQGLHGDGNICREQEHRGENQLDGDRVWCREKGPVSMGRGN